MNLFSTRGVLAAEVLVDRRASEVLISAAARAQNQVEVGDFVAAAIRLREPTVLATLRAALYAGRSVDELFETTDVAAGARRSVGPVGRDAFSAEASELLEEFMAIVGAHPQLSRVALEVLLCCDCERLVGKRTKMTSLVDPVIATGHLKGLIRRSLNSESGTIRDGRTITDKNEREDDPFILPAELAPSENLTFQLKAASQINGESPFDGVPLYDRLFDSLCRALHHKQRRHVLLVGERGVGLTTIVAELARRCAAGRVTFLDQVQFVSASCRFISPSESARRLLGILSHVGHRGDLVVAIEGMKCLLEGDRPSENHALLWAGLSRARCRLIGLMTPREYEACLADDTDTSEFFQRIEVPEPDVDVATKLLTHYVQGIERQYGVRVDPSALRQAVTLSAAYILNDCLPGKALRLLQETCETLHFEQTELGRAARCVTSSDVVAAVSHATGVPQETLAGIAEQVDYAEGLRQVIFGQDHAVNEVAAELGLIKAGLTDPGKPASVMLFVGQTGTGKTELAKALARFYSTSKRLRTYTLGNFVEPHSVSGVIGVPPGYVGHERGGSLINDLNADPFGVFLLDEADKAHPDVLQPFLNLFDEGWIIDQRGVKACASKSIFILTTNVGQRQIEEWWRQGSSIEEITNKMKESLSQIRHTKSNRPVFTPEFLARVKRIIVFRPLDAEAMQSIARRLVGQMCQSWQQQRERLLEVDPSVTTLIGQRAHEINAASKGKEGGRIVRKIIADSLETKLQREISRRPQAYREARQVMLHLPNGGQSSEDLSSVMVAFGSRLESEVGEQ